jgi:hypothetical protein
VPTGGYLNHAIDRRVPWKLALNGKDVQVTTPEDVILMKLIWRKDTKSAKQWENALGVVRTQRQNLNWSYLTEKAIELEIADDLEDLKNEAGI